MAPSPQGVWEVGSTENSANTCPLQVPNLHTVEFGLDYSVLWQVSFATENVELLLTRRQ